MEFAAKSVFFDHLMKNPKAQQLDTQIIEVILIPKYQSNLLSLGKQKGWGWAFGGNGL